MTIPLSALWRLSLNDIATESLGKEQTGAWPALNLSEGSEVQENVCMEPIACDREHTSPIYFGAEVEQGRGPSGIDMKIS